MGPHINDFVSFQQRLVIDLVPDEEGEAAAKARAERHAWLKEHNYQVVTIRQAEIERDLSGVLDSLSAVLAGPL